MHDLFCAEAVPLRYTMCNWCISSWSEKILFLSAFIAHRIIIRNGIFTLLDPSMLSDRLGPYASATLRAILLCTRHNVFLAYPTTPPHFFFGFRSLLLLFRSPVMQ